MNESGELFDMSDAPFVEKFVLTETDASKAARIRLTTVLAELNPSAGKTDRDDVKAGGKALMKRKMNGRKKKFQQ